MRNVPIWISCCSPYTFPRLRCLVRRSFERVPHQLLLVACHLRRTELVGQLVDFAGKTERQLVAVIHRRAGVAPDIKGFVDGHECGNGVRHLLTSDLTAINRQYTRAALARAGAVVLEVEHNRVLAGLERIAEQVATSYAAFPAEPLQIEHVVTEHRLAFEQVKGVSAEATAQRHD